MANAFGNIGQNQPPNQAPSGQTAPPSSAEVSVTITSEPPGADIEIDGSYEGNTPTQTMLAPAEYVIRVARPGYKAWERKVIIKAGSAKTFNAILEQE
ncbi:MAG: PEGA domain-containing protein [Pyrinomonadaceae bacterium]|nr:PEGA domain-containing protein [Pyrinomonadaceae bacterium]